MALLRCVSMVWTLCLLLQLGGIQGLTNTEELDETYEEEIISLAPERSKRSINMNTVRAKLTGALGRSDIPSELEKIVGVLDKVLKVLDCLPTQKSGNCYTAPKYCEVDVRDFTLQVRLTVCTSPWQIKLDFKVPSELKKKIPGIIRPLVFIKVNPIVLTLQHNEAHGITKLVSNQRIATGGIKLLFGIGFNAVKAYFNFDLTVRWDCTKPRNNHALRLQYNTAYNNGNDMNKLYYKLKIGYEIKTKRFPCFCYKCKKCETIVNEQGDIAEGPRSCLSDWSAWSPARCSFFMNCEGIPRRRTCVGQSKGGPACPGSSTSACGGRRGKRRISERERFMQCP